MSCVVEHESDSSVTVSEFSHEEEGSFHVIIFAVECRDNFLHSDLAGSVVESQGDLADERVSGRYAVLVSFLRERSPLNDETHGQR